MVKNFAVKPVFKAIAVAAAVIEVSGAARVWGGVSNPIHVFIATFTRRTAAGWLAGAESCCAGHCNSGFLMKLGGSGL